VSAWLIVLAGLACYAVVFAIVWYATGDDAPPSNDAAESPERP
jgi:hypothetical protein